MIEFGITTKMKMAISVAAGAHNGQKDKGGVPYITHCFRVALASLKHGEDAFCVGMLHDLLEDTAATHQQLFETFGKDISDAVDAISRRKGEQYFDYIKRCAENKLARFVKIEDLKDNSSPERVAQLPESERGVVKRYNKALVILKIYELERQPNEFIR